MSDFDPNPFIDLAAAARQASGKWRDFARETVGAADTTAATYDPAWWNLAALLLIFRGRVWARRGIRSIDLPTKVMVSAARIPFAPTSPADPLVSGAVARALESGWAVDGRIPALALQLTDTGIGMLVDEMTRQGRRPQLVAVAMERDGTPWR